MWAHLVLFQLSLTSSLLVNTSSKCSLRAFALATPSFWNDFTQITAWLTLLLNVDSESPSQRHFHWVHHPQAPLYTKITLRVCTPTLGFFRKDSLRRWPLSTGLDEVRIGTMKTCRKWTVYLKENAKVEGGRGPTGRPAYLGTRGVGFWALEL